MQSELLCLAASSTSLQESVLCCFPHPAGLEWARIEAQADKLHQSSPFLKCTVGVTAVRISSNNKGKN